MRNLTLLLLPLLLGCLTEIVDRDPSPQPDGIDRTPWRGDEEAGGDDEGGDDPVAEGDYRLILFNNLATGWDGLALDIYDGTGLYLGNVTVPEGESTNEVVVSADCLSVVYDEEHYEATVPQEIGYVVYDASDPSVPWPGTALFDHVVGYAWATNFADCVPDPEPNPAPIDPALTDVIIQLVVPGGIHDTVLKPSGAWGVPEGEIGSESNPIVFEETNAVGLRLASAANPQNGKPGSVGQNYFQTIPLGPYQVIRGFPTGHLNFNAFGANGPSPSLIVSYFGTPCESPLYFPVGWPRRGLALSMQGMLTNAEETVLNNWNHAYSEFWFIRNGSGECE